MVHPTRHPHVHSTGFGRPLVPVAGSCGPHSVPIRRPDDLPRDCCTTHHTAPSRPTPRRTRPIIRPVGRVLWVRPKNLLRLVTRLDRVLQDFRPTHSGEQVPCLPRIKTFLTLNPGPDRLRPSRHHVDPHSREGPNPSVGERPRRCPKQPRDEVQDGIRDPLLLVGNVRLARVPPRDHLGRKDHLNPRSGRRNGTMRIHRSTCGWTRSTLDRPTHRDDLIRFLILVVPLYRRRLGLTKRSGMSTPVSHHMRHVTSLKNVLGVRQDKRVEVLRNLGLHHVFLLDYVHGDPRDAVPTCRVLQTQLVLKDHTVGQDIKYLQEGPQDVDRLLVDPVLPRHTLRRPTFSIHTRHNLGYRQTMFLERYWSTRYAPAKTADSLRKKFHANRSLSVKSFHWYA